MTAESKREGRGERRREKEGEEAEEEGNRMSEMFPITGVEDDRSCAWIHLRGREIKRKECSLYAACFLSPVATCLLGVKVRDAKRKRMHVLL